jgi:hypothetical protein
VGAPRTGRRRCSSIRAIEQCLPDTLARPDAAARQIAAAAETRDVGLIRAQLDAVAPAFAPGLRLDSDVLESNGPTASSTAALACARRSTSACARRLAPLDNSAGSGRANRARHRRTGSLRRGSSGLRPRRPDHQRVCVRSACTDEWAANAAAVASM